MTVAVKSQQEAAPRTRQQQQDMTLEEFQEILKRAALQPGVPPPLVNAFRSASWSAEVAVFRHHEEELLSNGTHRPFLSELIGSGEAIIYDIGRTGFTEAATVFTLEDLKSTLESLHTTFRCEYGPKNSQQTDEQIMKLFNV